MPILIDRIPVKTLKFPAGESHITVTQKQINQTVTVEALLDSNDRIMELLLTIDAIRRLKPDVKIELTIPYFPYARQDRVCNKGEALSVKVMANLIDSLQCDRVTIIDPHSDVTPALLNNCHVIDRADIIANSNLAQKIRQENWALISPDAGAVKKTREIAKSLMGEDFVPDIFYADKVRDTKTGKITATTFEGDVNDRKVLIVDDICDGGKTFIELAKVLHARGVEQKYLYITHGIFSHGLEVLQPYFQKIYCYHTLSSQPQQNSDFLKIMS